MEPIVSIITSYHGYSSSCISLLALVSRLSRNIAQKNTLLLQSLREVRCKYLLAQSGLSNLIKIISQVLGRMDKNSPIHVLCMNIVFLTQIESLAFFI